MAQRNQVFEERTGVQLILLNGVEKGGCCSFVSCWKDE